MKYENQDTRIDFDWGHLRDAGEPVVKYFGFKGVAPGDPHLVVRVDQDSNAPSFPPDHEVLADDWFGCLVGATRDELVVQRGPSILRIFKERGQGVMHVRDEADQRHGALSATLFLFVSFSLIYAMQRRGGYILHGAAVSDADGNGILFLGASDTGKSTLTLSLVREGWGYLSDDSLVVRREGEGVTARPFRSDFGLDPEAGVYFPEIAASKAGGLLGGEKWRVKIREVFPDLQRYRCTPRLLIFPEIGDRTESRIEPISKTSAMTRVIGQGSFLFASSEPADARQQIELFKALIEQCGTMRMISGKDVTDNARAVSDRFRGLIAASTD